MKVKYIGHGDMISADWNGKRYVFRKREPVSEIPSSLYDYIKSSNFIYKHDIVAVEDVIVPGSAIKAAVPETMTKVVPPPSVMASFRRPGRPRKGR